LAFSCPTLHRRKRSESSTPSGWTFWLLPFQTLNPPIRCSSPSAPESLLWTHPQTLCKQPSRARTLPCIGQRPKGDTARSWPPDAGFTLPPPEPSRATQRCSVLLCDAGFPWKGSDRRSACGAGFPRLSVGAPCRPSGTCNRAQQPRCRRTTRGCRLGQLRVFRVTPREAQPSHQRRIPSRARSYYFSGLPMYCTTLSWWEGRTEMLPKNWTVTFTLPLLPTLDHFLGREMMRVPSLGSDTDS
jgi:hypothetical protein